MDTPLPRSKMLGYSLGDGVASIIMNGIGNFAMLFYTQILGINPAHAGIALGITTFWDAISDPLMGHISDNTRSRLGRRIPYLMPSGIFAALAFLSLWTLPQTMDSATSIFWCILILNLLLRTLLTIFMVPHTALGFELYTGYVDRSRLQGTRNFVNQATNLIFGAFAWTLFFKDGISADGNTVDGTSNAANYLKMGVSLSVVAVVILAIYMISIWSNREDTRKSPGNLSSGTNFLKNTLDIFKDRLAWYVFGLVGLSLLAMLLVSQVQMFTYVYYMKFTALEKTFTHGAGMAASAIGSLWCLPILVKKFDKRGAAYMAIATSCFGGIALSALFNGGILEPGQRINSIPVSTIAFALLQSLWWGGAGILVALSMSMIADVSEIHYLKKGELKDGSYSASLTFFQKASMSLGLVLTGGMVEWTGLDPQETVQSSEALRNISMLTFLSGPLIMILVLFAIRRYPVNKSYLNKLRKAATQHAEPN